MNSPKDHPGVYVPPPLFYVAVFLLAAFVQSKMPIDESAFHHVFVKIIGITIILIAVIFFLFRSLRQFFKSKNTVITILPANSLQTDGIYSVTRNPMYAGLALVYLGVTCFIGSWWNIILFPFLLLVVQELIIKREEKYLVRRFGQSYLEYKKKVRRWL
jgi:protein-S-isoprenylcysteine O-methyltransferase Ste14